MKRRSINCRSEDAQHPFRQMLAPAVLNADMLFEEQPKPTKERWWKKEDTHLFLVSFCAFFVVFYTFIA